MNFAKDPVLLPEFRIKKLRELFDKIIDFRETTNRRLPQHLYIIEFQKMKMQGRCGHFISKLQTLLSNSDYMEVLSWAQNNTIIEVLDLQKMEQQILPLYFRHSKFESFVRQLNLYGFKKLKNPSRHRFTHPLLLSGQPLSSITSVKTLKQKNQTDIGLKCQKSDQERGSSQQDCLRENRKQGSSAFGPYNPNDGNKITNIGENQFQSSFQLEGSHQFPQIYFIPSNPMIYWSMMNYFNGNNHEKSILLGKNECVEGRMIQN